MQAATGNITLSTVKAFHIVMQAHVLVFKMARPLLSSAVSEAITQRLIHVQHHHLQIMRTVILILLLTLMAVHLMLVMGMLVLPIPVILMMLQYMALMVVLVALILVTKIRRLHMLLIHLPIITPQQRRQTLIMGQKLPLLNIRPLHLPFNNA
jgi:hypothetical protein